MNTIAKAVLAACLCAPLSAPASLPYTDLHVFGDSLSDAGWNDDFGGWPGDTLRYTHRVGPTYQPFSGEVTGPVAAMMLGAQMGLSEQGLLPANQGGNNWAVGGAQTTHIYDFVAGAGGYLESRNGQADASALYFIDGGGNDFLFGGVLDAAGARDAAGRLVDTVVALQQAGARYLMVWLLPDIGLTPALYGMPEEALYSALTDDFNRELVRQLAAVQAEVIPLNVNLFLKEIAADAARFGFITGSDLIGTCFDGCLFSNSDYGLDSGTPDPSRLMFADMVHPTVSVHRLISDYAFSLLAAPSEITLLPTLALHGLSAHQAELRSHWLADRGAWQKARGWRHFIGVSGQRAETGASVPRARGNSYSLDFGSSYRVDQRWRLGLAASIQERALDAGAADSEYSLRGYVGSLFAQYHRHRWWGELTLSGGRLDYRELERRFRLGVTEGAEQGETRGALWAAAARFGVDLAPAGSTWRLGPFLSADYARLKVEGYQELGQRSTALRYQRQGITSRRFGAGLAGAFEIRARTRLLAEASVEREQEDDVRMLGVSLVSVPGITYRLPGYRPDDRVVRGLVGVSHRLAEGLSMRGGYHYAEAGDNALHGVSLSLTLEM